MLTLVAAQAEHQPTGLIVFEESSLARRARAAGATVAVVSRRAFRCDGSLRHESDLRRLVELATSVGAGVLHAHVAIGLRWMWRIADAADLRLVCHQRDNFSHDDYHRYVHRADRIIAVSRSVLATLPTDLRRRASVVHNAVQMPERHCAAEPVCVGMAARSVTEKGMHLFLDAVIPLMSAYRFDVTIWGLWSSDERRVSWSVMQRIWRLDGALRARIKLHRFREDVEEFFATTGIVVVPSLYPEPFGRMALESMAWGCVTIVAGHGGLVEIVDDEVTGLVFQPGDAVSLRQKLETALTDATLCAEMRRNGRTRARDVFSPEAHDRDVQRIYETL